MSIQVLGVDPRALSTAKLKAPSPLPFVSRRALARVRDRVAIPSVCTFCNSGVELVNNSEIYGRSWGDWPFVYCCINCNAYVGLHKETDLPLGTMADLATRDARKAGKIPFMTITRAKFKGNRNKSYEWLATKLEIDKKLCHFGMMDEATALRAMHICFDAIFTDC